MLSQDDLEREIYEGRLKERRDAQTLKTLYEIAALLGAFLGPVFQVQWLFRSKREDCGRQMCR